MLPEPGVGTGRLWSETKKKLLGGAGVLLAPELGRKRRQDAVENLKPVDQGVMGGAEGDEQLLAGHAGLR